MTSAKPSEWLRCISSSAEDQLRFLAIPFIRSMPGYFRHAEAGFIPDEAYRQQKRTVEKAAADFLLAYGSPGFETAHPTIRTLSNAVDRLIEIADQLPPR
ncbi:MAG: hypothetical protein AAF141_02715 [Pseudomonadota bacterium]